MDGMDTKSGRYQDTSCLAAPCRALPDRKLLLIVARVPRRLYCIVNSMERQRIHVRSSTWNISSLAVYWNCRTAR
jgi:hypothetical protein